jgi:D-glycero-alpha-D-manno-heptose-7-phosphate kinase
VANRGSAGPGTSFRVVVPNRVDIAGGTLDIYPLYLLVDGAMTVNAAVTVRSVVEVRPFARRAARLRSGNFGMAVTASDTHRFSPDGKMGLLSRALRHYPPVRGVEFRVRNEAPIGSGIGASSALLVALMLAAARLTRTPARWADTARAAMEIEAAHLRSLTGRQDHVAALRGGVQGIRFLPGRIEALRLPPGGPAGRMLTAHGFLAHTGIAHRSSDVNWRMVRGAIDGDAATLRKFRGIAGAARDAWAGVCGGDAAATANSMSAEWAIRRTLAAGVSPRPVEELFASRAFRRIVAGAKLCGAGGGGMLFGLLRDPGERAALSALLAGAGMTVVPFLLSGGARVEAAGDGG